MWWRVLAGLVPGFFAAAALTGLLCWLPPGKWEGTIVPGIIAFVPLWMTTFAASFGFRSALRANAAWSVIAIAGFALLWLLRSTGWAQ